MKTITIISSSNRINSSSRILAEKVKEGALANGNKVNFIDLNRLSFTFCKGCLACQSTGSCIIKDDIASVLDIVSQSDSIVLATPIYYYSVSGQLKTFLDRLNPLYPKNNKFKDFYLVATCADDNPKAIDGAITEVNGFLACFEGTRLANVLRGLSVNSPSDLEKLNYEEKAFEFGKNL